MTTSVRSPASMPTLFGAFSVAGNPTSTVLSPANPSLVVGLTTSLAESILMGTISSAIQVSNLHRENAELNILLTKQVKCLQAEIEQLTKQLPGYGNLRVQLKVFQDNLQDAKRDFKYYLSRRMADMIKMMGRTKEFYFIFEHAFVEMIPELFLEPGVYGLEQAGKGVARIKHIKTSDVETTWCAYHIERTVTKTHRVFHFYPHQFPNNPIETTAQYCYIDSLCNFSVSDQSKSDFHEQLRKAKLLSRPVIQRASDLFDKDYSASSCGQNDRLNRFLYNWRRQASKVAESLPADAATEALDAIESTVAPVIPFLRQSISSKDMKASDTQAQTPSIEVSFYNVPMPPERSLSHANSVLISEIEECYAKLNELRVQGAKSEADLRAELESCQKLLNDVMPELQDCLLKEVATLIMEHVMKDFPEIYIIFDNNFLQILPDDFENVIKSFITFTDHSIGNFKELKSVKHVTQSQTIFKFYIDSTIPRYIVMTVGAVKVSSPYYVEGQGYFDPMPRPYVPSAPVSATEALPGTAATGTSGA